jgi:hypothetical protein
MVSLKREFLQQGHDSRCCVSGVRDRTFMLKRNRAARVTLAIPTWDSAQPSAAARSNRASRGRLLLAGPAKQVDEVLMKFEPGGVVGVAVRRGEIAVIADLEPGKRV